MKVRIYLMENGDQQSAFVPERSNGVDLKSIVETLVGSNPTGRDFFLHGHRRYLLQVRRRVARPCWVG